MWYQTIAIPVGYHLAEELVLSRFTMHILKYVGIFDYDGEKSTDDFIGRVVIDLLNFQMLI